MKYKHIFFDLDNTLWDFDASSAHTFELVYAHFHLKELGVSSLKAFVERYHLHNDRMWALYREGKMEKDILRNLRFELTLNDFGTADPVLAKTIADFYLYHAPRNVFLLPDAIETLACLSRSFSLHIITNGFEEVQHIKLETSGMGRFFDQVITSEAAGVKKPDPGIFSFALEKTGAKANESLMVGDDLVVDVEGAIMAGMDAVFFNPNQLNGWKSEAREIRQLSDLCELLGVKQEK
ncbi:MAG: noncanonical pyrimidine nucleotidase, YjjG family [Bacteroidales bacterium]|nr:noncanonical pyrimidine nucleotidase, YjjG family [Bacteroidales bacterium]